MVTNTVTGMDDERELERDKAKKDNKQKQIKVEKKSSTHGIDFDLIQLGYFIAFLYSLEIEFCIDTKICKTFGEASAALGVTCSLMNV